MSRFRFQQKDEKRRAHKRTFATLIVLLVLILPFIGFGGWMWFQINSFGDPGKKVTVDIPRGSSTTDIGNELEKSGIVRSGSAFAFYTKLARRGPYQAGQYVLNKNIDASQAATVLEKGPKINYDKFTIIPGQRLSQITENVGKLPRLSAEKYAQLAASGEYVSKYSPQGSTNLEGLLLPETYSVSSTETEANILRRPLEEFDARASANGLGGDFKGLSAYQVIIVASLIEKEAKYAPDKELIASVIYNRLAANMRLQIDASVIYGLGRSGGAPTRAELQQDGPFNSYTRYGLPPTPISMITMSSLRAALNPASTDYLYYVLSDAKTGKHAFAHTYEQHLANIDAAKASGDL